jgi:hypothetical protein
MLGNHITGLPRALLACASATVVVVCGCGGSAAKQASRHGRAPAPAPARPPVGSHYSPRLRATLVHTCVAAAGGTAGAASRCGCTVSYLEAHVPQRTLEATERAVLEGKAREPDWMLNAILACQKV